MQEIVHLRLHEVADELVYAYATLGGGCLRTQFHLCLALKHGFLYVYAYGGNKSVADVAILVVLSRIVLDNLGNILLEGCLVRTAQGGVLAVHEGIVFLAILLGVREGNLYVLAPEMTDGIQGVVIHAVVEQVGKTVARMDAPAVEHDGKARVQVGVVAQHYLYELVAELIVLEQGGVGFEEYVCTVLVLSGFGGVAHEDALLEDGLPDLSVAIGMRLEMAAQCIHRLQTYTVQANTLLESLGVILATGVQHGHSLHQFALRYATAIVADAGTQVVLDVHFYALASIHLELVDTVVNDLLQQHIYAILCLLAIAQATDVHARSGADMLHVREMPDIAFVVSYFLYLRAFLYIFHGLGMQV